MRVGTERLKNAVAKSIKGCGFNKLIPLTELIGIKLENGNLQLSTTDMTNQLAVVLDKVSGDDFNVTVEADKFGKLVNKMTSTEISLDVKDDTFFIKGNGTYKLPLISDEEGLVEFPEIDCDIECTHELKLTSVMSAYNINRTALAKTFEQPALTGYYCGENVVTSDAVVITFNRFKMFDTDESLLISPQMMQLLTLNNEENIMWGKDDSRLLFKTENVIISGEVLANVVNYPIDAINTYLDITFDSMCKISKQLMLDVLDRLALFITPFDKNGAYFTFGRTGITVHSKKDSSTETVAYVESKDFKQFTCLADVVMMKEQLQACPDDTVTLWYGNENAIKFETGNVVQVIALLEDAE